MAELNQAFQCFNNENINPQNINLQTIDHFFTQRNMKESHEYLDKNMNRKSKKINMIYNFLAICIPVYNLNNDFNYNIQIFGDSGYYYNGIIKSFQGVIPNLMIPLKGDKKIFVHVNYKENIDNKECICFIDVPKRYQSVDKLVHNLRNDEDDQTLHNINESD